MKASVLAVAVSFLALSGWALAAQTAEQKEHPTMSSNSMMQGMMKDGGKEGEHMGGMMRMMKMMDQCSAMMESVKADSAEPQQCPKAITLYERRDLRPAPGFTVFSWRVGSEDSLLRLSLSPHWRFMF